MDEKHFKPNVLLIPKPVDTIGSTYEPILFLPVAPLAVPYIRGMLLHLNDSKFWIGTDEEIEQALTVIKLQAAEPVKTPQEICDDEPIAGVQLRTTETGKLEYRSMLNFPEPPFIFDVDIRGEAPNQEYWLIYDSEVNPMGWVEAGPLPPGAPGTNGIDGINGIDGVDGINGVDGVDGTNGIDGINGVDGVDGINGETRMTFINNHYVEGSAPHVIMFEGQHHRYNFDTQEWEPISEVFDFGVPLVAPIGPQGIPGTDGADGEGTTIIYQEPVGTPARSQTRIWAYIARELMSIYAEIAVSSEVEGFINLVQNTLYRIGIAYLPIDILLDEIGELTPSVVSAFTSSSVQDNAAKLLYCEMIQQPQLSDQQLTVISEALGEPADYNNNPALAAEILAAVVANLLEHEGNKTRSVVSTIRARSALVDPSQLPDYDSLPCTPVPEEEWNHVIDLTINDGGFNSGVNGSPTAAAIYVSGFGWKLSSGSSLVGVNLPFGIMANLAQVEVLFAAESGHFVEYTDYSLLRGGVPGESPMSLVQDFPLEDLPFFPLTWGGSQFTQGISITFFASNQAFPTYISRVSISGRGTNPFDI